MSGQRLRKELINVRGYHEQMSTETRVIEEKMLDDIASLLRVTQDEKDIQLKDITTDIKESIEKGMQQQATNSAQLEHLLKMKKNIENYKVPEMMLHIMWNAHSEWIIKNIEKEDLKNSENAGMFVPFALLSWKDVESKYLSILSPIFDSLKIDFKKEDLEKQFQRDQIVFLFQRGILSKEDLPMNMENILENSYEIIFNLNNKNKEKLYDKEAINNISKQVSSKIELNVIQKLKDSLMADKDEIGIIMVKNPQKRKKIYKFAENIGQRKFGFKKNAAPAYNKPISKILYDIATDNSIIFVQNIKKHDYRYFDYASDINRSIKFVPYTEGSDDQKKLIAKRNKKVKKFADKVKKSNNKKYLEPGLITFVTTDRFKATNEILQIPITLKELAELEILPQEIGWEARRRSLVNSKRSILITSGENKEKSQKTKNNFINNVRVNSDITLKQHQNIEKNNNEKQEKER